MNKNENRMDVFKTVAEFSSDWLMWKIYGGEVRYVSPAVKGITGYEPAEFIEDSGLLKRILHPEDREPIWRKFEDEQRDAHDSAIEFRIIRKDGEVCWISHRCRPILDDEGMMAGRVSSNRDITAWKLAEETLRKMARIIEQAAEVIAVADTEGRLEYVNPAFEKITGYAAAEAVGKNMRFLKSGEEPPPEFYSTIWKTVKGGDTWKGVFLNRKKNGAEYYEEAEIFPIRDKSGAIVNYAKIARDITETRTLEAQLAQSQKLEAIGALAGGVAHDFNNLLTVINGNAEMALLKIDDKERLRHYIAAIQQTGERARNLTGQLLAFSRKQICQPEILDMNAAIVSIDKMARRLIGEDIEIETSLAVNLPRIKADNTQLEQILVNLLVNARDALHEVKTPDFHKKITVETGTAYLDLDYTVKHPGSRRGLNVFFSVADNGAGMDEQTQRRIFEPFFTTKEKHKGTGLGLSTVYGIVKQNSGSVTVYSEPGRGTTIRIYWPATEEIKDSTHETTADAVISRGDETILVVEDDRQVLNFASESLTSLGYRIYSAENGRQALQLLKKGSLKLDLFLTDVIMPEMGGREFVEKARKLYPDVQAIFTSGYTDDHITHGGMLEPGINFLPKPYSRRELAAAVRRCLGNRKA